LLLLWVGLRRPLAFGLPVPLRVQFGSDWIREYSVFIQYLATYIVRSYRDLAKPYLQVVHSGVLASSEPPVSPHPNKGHTCA